MTPHSNDELAVAKEESPTLAEGGAVSPKSLFPDAVVESPVAIDMAPEFAVEELPVARLRSPLEDPALLPLASAVARLAVPELASSLIPDVIDMIPPPVEEPEPPEIVTEPP